MASPSTAPVRSLDAASSEEAGPEVGADVGGEEDGCEEARGREALSVQRSTIASPSTATIGAEAGSNSAAV